MSQRTIRVNELLRRELSDVLHTQYQQESVRITISQVNVSPDLRSGRVGYSVLGGAKEQDEAERFFRKRGGELNHLVSQRVVLKYSPKLSFHYDPGLEESMRVNTLIDELEAEDEA